MTKQRVSVEDAASHLGVSVATIRRRMKRGELEVEAESDAPNARKWILLESKDNEPEDLGTSEAPTDPVQNALTVRLEDEVTYLRGVIETRDKELAEMRLLLARAQQQQEEKLSAIEATVTTVAGHTTPVVEEAKDVQDRGGFWDRLRAWFSPDHIE